MTNSSFASSSDLDSLIPDIFDDNIEAGHLQNAVSIMMSGHLEKNGNKYCGKSLGARTFNCGTCTWFDILVTMEDLERKKNGQRRSFAEESGRVVLVLYMIR